MLIEQAKITVCLYKITSFPFLVKLALKNDYSLYVHESYCTIVIISVKIITIVFFLFCKSFSPMTVL